MPTLRTLEALEAEGLIKPEPRLAAAAHDMAIAITPEMAALIDRADPARDPIGRQFVPSAAETEVAPGELADNGLIFLSFQRAGGINQTSSRSQHGKSGPKNLHLSLGLASELLWSDAPLDLRVSAKRAGAGAGGVEQDAVEDLGEGQRV